jgi:hypothetical protein
LVITALLATLSCGDALSQGVRHSIVTQLPGAAPFAEALTSQLDQAWTGRDDSYKPRTRHLNEDGTPKFTNRLLLEGSPYLLQHAHNPMNWRPWGDEAFETARRLGRPVLLSIGYSTCHWCHVMEEESFDDIEIAEFINENYIAIKVDREERPDIDSIYMSAVQAMSGHGGWPMTSWLTPDRKPFYAGTYFPARDGDRGVAKGFLTILRDLKAVYDEQPENVASRADQIAARVEAMLEPETGSGLPDAQVLQTAARYYSQRFDEANGGTKGAPKFPSSLSIRFLLRHYRRTGDARSLQIVETTLEHMAAGGIYDHVGGGFHRYSTDAEWQVPHFEKMLYDNALLVVVYLEAYQATGREDFARIAREILRYVERDMTSPEGGFYSATDADSPNPEGEREEGWFFTWTPTEIDAVLNEEEARLVRQYYKASAEGNFEGRNILHTEPGPSTISRQLQAARDKLYAARLKRPPPLRDEKILTAWNGLMISAHAFAALVLDEDDYARRAERAADFLLTNLRRDGRLLRRHMGGEARHDGYLDDYAFLISGLLDLYEATGNLRWLREAVALDRVLEENYEDGENGGFFMTSDDHEELLAREKPNSDGAEPSGNSVALLNLVRLHEFTTSDAYRQRAVKALRAFQPILAARPAALSEMLLALDFHLDIPKQIVIVTPNNRAEATPLLNEFRMTLLPNRVLSVVTQGDELAQHTQLIPLLDQKRAIKGQPTAYVCENRVCELPTGDPARFAEQLRKVELMGSQSTQ